MPTSNTTLNRVHQFRDAWQWPEDVERWIRQQCDGLCLSVCSGQSSVGDISIDADKSLSPHIQGDMHNLPFPDATFQTVVADPPWREVDIFQRHSLFYELVRVTALRGTIIHNATWVPESDQCDKLAEYRRQDGEFTDASVISVFCRYPGQQTLDEI